MSTVNLNNPFISYNLTPQEIIQGSQLSLLQKQCIQNMIASYAAERLSREISVTSPLATVQADAKNQGQIEALRHLLDLSDAADEAIRNPSTAPQEGNS